MSLSGPVSGHHYVDVRAQQVWSKSMAPLESLLTYWKTKKLDSSEVPAAFTFQLRSQFAINLFHFLGEFCLKENRGRDSWGFFHTFFSFVAWKKFHENDMLLRFGQSKPKPSQQLQHHIKQGKRAKQQILHDVAKMILYKAYHLGHGLGLIMVILHQHTQQIRIKISCQEKYICTNQNLEFWTSNLKKYGLFVKLLKLTAC